MTIVPATFIIFVALLPAITTVSSSSLDVFGFALLSAWLGTGMIAASLLLMIREPFWATWFGGLQHMYQWHHGMGILGFVFLLVHPLLLAIDYWPLGPASTWEYLSPFDLDLVNILGWIALLIFTLGLAVTFIQRLPYGLWRRIHMSMIIAMALGLWHIWVISGISNGLIAIFLPVIVSVAWRILRVDQGIGALPYEVSAVYHLAENITEVILLPLTKPMLLVPSQFVSAAFFEGPHFQGCGDFHPYTVSHIAKDGRLTLSIKALGDCTRHIQSLEPGVAALLQGPYGTFLLNRPIEPEVWVAAGIGLTPFLALLRSEPIKQNTDFIYVHRESNNVSYENELERLARSQPLLRFHSLAMPNDLTSLFMWLESIDNLAEKQVYLCGPPSFMAKVTKWLKEKGISRQKIHFEQFDFR